MSMGVGKVERGRGCVLRKAETYEIGNVIAERKEVGFTSTFWSSISNIRVEQVREGEDGKIPAVQSEYGGRM